MTFDHSRHGFHNETRVSCYVRLVPTHKTSLVLVSVNDSSHPFEFEQKTVVPTIVQRSDPTTELNDRTLLWSHQH